MRLSVVGFVALSGLWSGLALGQAIMEFPVPSSPTQIVSGPDGNLWFSGGGNLGLGRMTLSGQVTQFPSVQVGDAHLVFDADGNLWFPYGYRIKRRSPDGQITEFMLPEGGRARDDIVIASDHNIWFTEDRAIGRITPLGSITEFPLSGTPYGLAAGPDGNLWFTEARNLGTPLNHIGRITLSGTITEFALPGTSTEPYNSIAAGSDGALWFTNQSGKIRRITPSGVLSEFAIPGFEGGFLGGITSGPDGAIWFTDGPIQVFCVLPGCYFPPPAKLGRISPDGLVTEIPMPSPLSYIQGITTGADGNLWVAEESPGKLARVTVSGSACTSDSNTMCLAALRFRVSTAWQSPTDSGIGTSQPLTSNTGAFWFFDPTNIELVVKVLDGRSINGKWWVFYGSLTNVEFTLTVTDTQTGAVKTYVNPQGQLASVADTSAF